MPKDDQKGTATASCAKNCAASGDIQYATGISSTAVIAIQTKIDSASMLLLANFIKNPCTPHARSTNSASTIHNHPLTGLPSAPVSSESKRMATSATTIPAICQRVAFSRRKIAAKAMTITGDMEMKGYMMYDGPKVSALKSINCPPAPKKPTAHPKPTDFQSWRSLPLLITSATKAQGIMLIAHAIYTTVSGIPC